MKTLDNAESCISTTRVRSRSRQPKRRPNARPAPSGIPDARGWAIYVSTNKKRPLITHYARAFFPERAAQKTNADGWITRSFRSEIEASLFVTAENAINPAFQAAAQLADASIAAAPASAAEKLLTSPECARRLRLSLDGLQNARERGLPFIKVSRGALRYRWSEVAAWLKCDREPLQLPPDHWTVEAYSEKGRPERKFVARKEGNKASAPKRFFQTETAAMAFARKANSALGRRPLAPVPEIVRGMKPNGALWRAWPLTCTAQPYYRFEVRAKVEGKWKSAGRFRTQREALLHANELNFEALQQREQLAPAPAESAALKSAAPALPPGKLPVPWEVPAIDAPLTAWLSHKAMRLPFRIKPCTIGKYRFYVRSSSRGKVVKKFFLTEREAKTYAHLRNTEAQQQGIESIEFPSWLRTMAQCCQQQLAPFNYSIDDATRFFVAHLERTSKSCKIGELIPKMLAVKTGQGVSKQYLADLKGTALLFAAHVGAETFVSEVTPPQINEFLLALPPEYSPTTRNCFHARISALLAFAKESGYCASNEARAVGFAKQLDVPVGILTPEQLAGVLNAALGDNMYRHFIPFLAIGAFAGLRGSELRRLDWSEVDLNDGFIEVTAAKSKTASRRLVKILPALDAWIRPFAKASGAVYPNTTFAPQLMLGEPMKKAGLTSWPRNALRHSFASYHLAHFKNAAELALELGHTTTQLIFAHYRQVVRSAHAERYWQILPPGAAEAGKVVNFTAIAS